MFNHGFSLPLEKIAGYIYNCYKHPAYLKELFLLGWDSGTTIRDYIPCKNNDETYGVNQRNRNKYTLYPRACFIN